ncbi:MAG TPA: hypothetical protein VMB81_17825 [Candidatus Sulfotelmatobacter sp.]|nr:hypothetical protein [Candidatus Sulfotelmatobacter sp.]
MILFVGDLLGSFAIASIYAERHRPSTMVLLGHIGPWHPKGLAGVFHAGIDIAWVATDSFLHAWRDLADSTDHRMRLGCLDGRVAMIGDHLVAGAYGLLPDTIRRLSRQPADILLTVEEAPSYCPGGGEQLDRLAGAMGARMIICGQAESYVAEHRRLGLKVVGVGPGQAVDEFGELIEPGPERQPAGLHVSEEWRRVR